MHITILVADNLKADLATKSDSFTGEKWKISRCTSTVKWQIIGTAWKILKAIKRPISRI